MDDSQPGFREWLHQMRWWHWLILVFVAAWSAGLVWLFTSLASEDPTRELAPVSYAGDVGVPGQVLLPSLRQQPVPGWRMNLKTVLADVTRPRVEHVGDVGTRAYFTVAGTERTTGVRRAWLLGVDVAQGVPSFAPVRIDNPVMVTCLLNGVTRVLCLNKDYGEAPGEAWVLDAQTGAVLSRTASTLQFDTSSLGDKARVVQIGSYAVAYEPETGWHGIDDQGRFTWTVKAVAGDMTMLKRQPGMPPSDIGVAKIDKDRSAVFSAVDGKVLRKSGGKLLPVVGGFAEQERQNKAARRSPTTFAFFDDSGNRVGRYDNQTGSPELLSSGLHGAELPVLSLSLSDQMLVLDSRGTPMTAVHVDQEVTPNSIGFLGGSMYLTDNNWSTGDRSTTWQKFDLRSGNRVSSCTGLPVEEDGYVGSDGTVVVAPQAGVDKDDAPTVAVDLDTCAVLWKIPEPGPMWAVGSTLVQALPASGELISLVPPAR
ncbi:hypothetical protein [Mycobacterium sp. NPDC004974]